MSYLKYLVVMVAVSLTACGGGSDSPVESTPTVAPPVVVVAPTPQDQPAQDQPAQDQPTAPPTPTDPIVVIEYYGDSIIWGWDGSRQEGPDGWPRVSKPAPQVFAEELGFEYADRSDPIPSNKSVVINMGHPSRLSEDALSGAWPLEAWASLMSKSPATHVILEYHSHDSQNTDRLRQVIQIAKSYGKKVIVETIGPGVHSGDLAYDQISEGQREAARLENVPIIDQTTYLSQWSLNSLCPDGLHPNQDAYTLKGKYAASLWNQFND